MAEKFLNYDELLKQAQKKKSERETANKFLDAEIKLDSIITIDPNKEIALAQYYSSIPGVELDDNITDFWNSQNSKINEFDMITPKNEYMSAFKELQEIQESIEDRKRDELGANNINVQKREARENLKEAETRLSKQQEEYSKMLKNEVNPFRALLGFITGDRKDAEKVEKAQEGIKSAKKSVQSAKKSLDMVKERKLALQQQRDKLSVKEYMARQKMSDALEKIYKNKDEAEKRNDQSEKIHDTLQKQYDIVDKLTAIQALKKSGTYPAIRTLLNSQNPGLLTELDNIPDSLPDNTLRISLTNPLTLSTIQIDTNKISEIEQKITETKNKLPNGINMNDLSNEIEKSELKDTDTIQDLENQMSTITNHTSKEYKTLEMKRNHLVLQEKVETTQSEIQTLKDELVNNGDSQDKLEKLKAKQDYLKILQEELQNDPYSKTISGLREVQSLQAEKKRLETPKNLANTNIDSTTQQLDNSDIKIPNIGNVSYVFNLIKDRIKENKENLPLNPQPTRSDPTATRTQGAER